MRTKNLKIIFILFLLSLISLTEPIFACQTEIQDTIEDSISLCNSNYTITNIKITKNNINFDCNNSRLTCSNNINILFLIQDKTNITITNCIIQDCQNAIDITNSKQIKLRNNQFYNNIFDITSLDSQIIKQNNTFTSQLFIKNSTQKTIKPITPLENKIINTKEYTNTTNNSNIQNNTEQIILEFNKELYQSLLYKIVNDEDLINKALINSKYLNNIITFSKTIITENNQTKILININQNNNNNNQINLNNYSIYEDIPKCAATLASEIIFNDNYHEIIIEDPLIQWKIQKKEIQYTIPKELPQSCKDLFKTIIIKNLKQYQIKETEKEIIISNTHPTLKRIISLIIIILSIIYIRKKLIKNRT